MPQALEGVAAVGLLYPTVRRRFSAAAGLIAGAVLALTPVAVADVPVQQPGRAARAAARRRPRTPRPGRSSAAARAGCVLAAALVGFGFLTKMLQAFVVVPGVRARLPALRADAAAPAHRRSCSPRASRWSSRPAGGSRSSRWSRPRTVRTSAARRHNTCSSSSSATTASAGSPGNETGSVVGGGATGTGGDVGRDRAGAGCSAARWAAQVSWLIPAALVLMAPCCGCSRRAPRTDGRRAVGAALGRLAVADRRGLQLRAGHHPPVLHGRAGAGDRRAGRHRRRHALAAPGTPWVRAVLGATVAGTAGGPGTCSGARRAGSRPCGSRSSAGIASAARALVGPQPPLAAALAATAPGGRAGRADGVRAADRVHPAHRGDPERGTHRVRPAASGRAGAVADLVARPRFGGQQGRRRARPRAVPVAAGGARRAARRRHPSSALVTLLRQGRRVLRLGGGDRRRQQRGRHPARRGAPVLAIGGFNGTDPRRPWPSSRPGSLRRASTTSSPPAVADSASSWAAAT